MEIREDLNILEDDNVVIKFEEITTKTDTVNRNEVAELEAKIQSLINEIDAHNVAIAELNVNIDDCKAKLAHARTIIAKADAMRVDVEVQQEGQF